MFPQWFKERQRKSVNDLQRAKNDAKRRTTKRLNDYVEKLEERREEYMANKAAAQVTSQPLASPTPSVETPADADVSTAPAVNPADTVSVDPVSTPTGDSPSESSATDSTSSNAEVPSDDASSSSSTNLTGA